MAISIVAPKVRYNGIPGKDVKLTAIIQGAPNNKGGGLVWVVLGDKGTINEKTGVLKIPPAEEMVEGEKIKVVATSLFDPTVSKTFTITVTKKTKGVLLVITGPQDPILAGEQNIRLNFETEKDPVGKHNYSLEIVSRPQLGSVSGGKYTAPKYVYLEILPGKKKPVYPKVKVRATSVANPKLKLELEFELRPQKCPKCKKDIKVDGTCPKCGQALTIAANFAKKAPIVP